MPAHLSFDFQTTCGNVLLLICGTSGWTNSRDDLTDPLEISGGMLSAMDIVVHRCDGPC